MADDRKYEFTLPDLGEGVMEGEVVKWLVQAGQDVKADEPLLQVMTDKATVEIPSPRRAKVVALHVNEGDIIPVGTAMLTLELAAGETRPIAHHAPAAPPPAGAKPAPAAPFAPAPAAARPAGPPPAAAPQRQNAAAAAVMAPPAAGAPQPARSAREVLATPATRALARELGVDIAQVAGSGPAGRVTREDVERQARGAAAPALAPAPAAIAPGPREERIPLRGLRRKIAERMVQSAFSAPHVTHVDEVDVTALAALRQKARPLAEARGTKLSYLPFVMKALVTTFRDFPYFNALFDEKANELVVKRYCNIGFAAATEQGLLVPVVKEVENKTIWQLAGEIDRLAKTTRQGKATMDELTGSTFSITNYGSVGGLWGTPIINHPEVAILGTGKTQLRPVVRDGQIAIREMMYLALSFDHRVIDGADAARFVSALTRYLESPELLLLDL